MSSDFMAEVTIHSDFRAKEEEICHYFHRFSLYLPWSNGARCHNLSFFNFLNLVLHLILDVGSYEWIYRQHDDQKESINIIFIF